MTLSAWLTIVGICCLGAMTPGPSLAVVLKHTLSGGRKSGLTAAIAHGLGVGLYAFACISGLALVILTSEALFAILQWGGAAYLLWIGAKSLLQKPAIQEALPDVPAKEAARDGFMIVFLNPKIALFFIALFSQVVGVETTLFGKVGYAATAMVIDALWYCIVAWLFSNPLWLDKLQKQAFVLEKVFGLLLVLLAIKLVMEIL